MVNGQWSMVNTFAKFAIKVSPEVQVEKQSMHVLFTIHP
jgi:hypothetical protein